VTVSSGAWLEVGVDSVDDALRRAPVHEPDRERPRSLPVEVVGLPPMRGLVRPRRNCEQGFRDHLLFSYPWTG